MRNRIVAGNWKMNLTVDQSVQLAKEISAGLGGELKTKVIIAPTYLSTVAVARAIQKSPLHLAVQDIDPHPEGAYTGKISITMVKDVGVSHIIIGHSEQRQYYGESDEKVNRKLTNILESGLTPIICIGETLDQRKNQEIESVLTKQLVGAYQGLPKAWVNKTVIAYEPVWAIGTGVTATDEQAEETIKLVREKLASRYDKEAADQVSILYGGSMKPGNAGGLLTKPNIDGGLIGGASLNAKSFLEIIKIADEK